MIPFPRQWFVQGYPELWFYLVRHNEIYELGVVVATTTPPPPLSFLVYTQKERRPLLNLISNS